MYKPIKKEESRDKDQNGKKHSKILRDNFQIRKLQVTLTEEEANIRKNLRDQKQSSYFILKNKSVVPATSILSQQPSTMAYNTTASLDKVTCTDHVVFRKNRFRLGRIFWSKADSYYLVGRPKVVRKNDNRDFLLVRNQTIREADIHQFMRLKNNLVPATKTFGRDQNLSPLELTTIFNDLEDQLKLV